MPTLTLALARDIRPGQILWDDVVKGLHLRGFAESAGWYFYYRTKTGRERRPALGKFPSLTIEGARKAARPLAEAVARGEDPKAKWQTEKDAPTVAELADIYLKRWVEVHNKPRSRSQFKWVVETIIKPGIGKLSVREVTIDTVEALIERVYNRDPAFRKKDRKDGYAGKTTTPGLANVTRAVLSKMFTLAEERWHFIEPGAHPVKGAKRFRNRKRKRLASLDELKAIGQLLVHYGNDADYKRRVACIWTLFFCGARVNEIGEATYEDFHGDRLLLQDHKTDQHTDEKVIFLPSVALEILAGLPRDPSGFIFGEIRISEFWRMLRKQIGATDLQLRDARRTFASHGLSNGLTLDQIGQLFGHTDPKTTRGYAWLLDGKAKSAVNATADTLSLLMLPSATVPPPSLPQRSRVLSQLRVRGRAAGTRKTLQGPR